MTLKVLSRLFKEWIHTHLTGFLSIYGKTHWACCSTAFLWFSFNVGLVTNSTVTRYVYMHVKEIILIGLRQSLNTNKQYCHVNTLVQSRAATNDYFHSQSND